MSLFMDLLTYPLARFFLRDHRRNAGLLVHALSYPHGFLEASGQYLPRMDYPQNPHVFFTRVTNQLGYF